MADLLKFSYTTQFTGASDTATIAAGAFNNSSTIVSSLTATNHNDWPMADVTLTFSGTNSISSASCWIVLYRRDINVDGTTDNPVPSTATPAHSSLPVGVFVAPLYTVSFSTAIALTLTDIPLAKECEFYVENKLNIPIGANWTLKVTPKTYNSNG